MAKKKPGNGGGSMSAAIREILSTHPNANVKDIKSKLEAKGIKASVALINKVKYTKPTRSGKSTRAKSVASKADAIRSMFERLGYDARPRDVIAALKQQGVVVTSAQVSMLRGKLSTNGGARAHVGGVVPYEHLLAAKLLASRLGGIDKARAALESFARLVQS